MADEKPQDVAPANAQTSENPQKTTEKSAETDGKSATLNPSSADGKKAHRKISLLAIFASTFLLFILVVALLILAMSINPPGQVNPVLRFFGQNEDTVKDFLVNLVNISFGFFSVFLLIIISVTLLLGFSQPKENKQKRAAFFAFSLVSVGLQIVTLFAWFGMYNLVLTLAAPPDPNRGEINLSLPDGRSFDPPVPESGMDEVTTSTELTFSAESLIRKHEAAGNRITHIGWDVGEGDFDLGISEKKITTTFPRTGEHTVRVRLTVNNGTETSDIIKGITFFIPRAHLAIAPENPVAGQKVTFDVGGLAAAYPGKKIFEWDFNSDNRPDAEETDAVVEYTYAYPGNYTIGLRLKDSKGLVHVYDWPVVIGEPKSDLMSVIISTEPQTSDPQNRDLQVVIGTTVKFDGSASNSPLGEIVAYEWTLSPGDQNPVKSPTYRHTFETEGVYEVILKVSDSQNNQDENSLIVTVVKKSLAPKAVLDVLKPNPEKGVVKGKAPLIVEFDASNSIDENDDIAEYQWDTDGDGSFEADRAGRTRVSHTYEKGGKYTAMLQVKDRAGNIGTATILIEVTEIKLTAAAKALTKEATAPNCAIGFDASDSVCRSENCRIETYEWDFGDGGKAFLDVPTVDHLYTRLGSFTARLTVHAHQENEREKVLKASDDVVIYCRDTPLNSTITASRLTGNAPATISFSSARSTGKILRYEWDFGDGLTSEEPITQHTYQNPGSYTVTLTVYDRENSFAKSTEQITILPR